MYQADCRRFAAISVACGRDTGIGLNGLEFHEFKSVFYVVNALKQVQLYLA